jgi:hypothetical protein
MDTKSNWFHILRRALAYLADVLLFVIVIFALCIRQINNLPKFSPWLITVAIIFLVVVQFLPKSTH